MTSFAIEACNACNASKASNACNVSQRDSTTPPDANAPSTCFCASST